MVARFPRQGWPLPLGGHGDRGQWQGAQLPSAHPALLNCTFLNKLFCTSFKSVEIFLENGMTNVIVTENFPNGYLKDKYQGYEKNAALAICKAALKAVGECSINEH